MSDLASTHVLREAASGGACIADCESDFDAVMADHRTRVFRFALASLRDFDAAETVTQDCFLKVHRAWDTFRNQCRLESWIMTIALNLVRDHARNRRLQFWRKVQMNAPPPEALANVCERRASSPEAHLLLKERIEAIWNTAATLPERQRTVFFLRFVNDFDVVQISEVTGLSEGTVRVHLFRAVHAVRDRVGRQ